jgi:two-component system, NarL family, nitrate/nitrite response regulator NarL
MPRGDVVVSGHTIGVLIVADVRLYREGLAASLASRNHLRVVATSSGRADAREKVHAAGVNVVVVDIAMRESLELIHDLHREAVATKVLAFAVEDVASDILDCAEAGAAGYVTADASVDDLVAAIERIADEELVCSPRVAARLFRRMSERSDGRATDTLHAKTLTIRERQVLDLIRQGLTNKEIAQRLNVAEPTVKSHVHNLLEKLNVPTRAQAAVRAATAASRRRSSLAPTPMEAG